MESIAETLAIPDADQAAERLIALALEAGAPDNVTVVVADVVDDEPGMPDTPVVGGAAAEQDTVPSATKAVVLPGGSSLTPEERAEKRARRSRGSPPPAPATAAASAVRARQCFRRRIHQQLRGFDPERPVDTGVFRLQDLPSAQPRSAEELSATPPAGMPPIGDEPLQRRHRRAQPLAGAGSAGRFPLAFSGALRRDRRRRADHLGHRGELLVRRGFASGKATLFHGLQSRPLGISLSNVSERGLELTELTQVDLSRVNAGIVAGSHAHGMCILARLNYDAQADAWLKQQKALPTPKANQNAQPTATPKPPSPPRMSTPQRWSRRAAGPVAATASPKAPSQPEPVAQRQPEPRPTAERPLAHTVAGVLK